MKSNLPTAVVEAVDPIVLNMKLVDVCECRPCDCELTEIPPASVPASAATCASATTASGSMSPWASSPSSAWSRRPSSLMPVYDYCMPEKECGCGGGSCEDDPCEIFRHVKFPVNEFFPPNAMGAPCDNYQSVKGCCT